MSYTRSEQEETHPDAISPSIRPRRSHPGLTVRAAGGRRPGLDRRLSRARAGAGAGAGSGSGGRDCGEDVSRGEVGGSSRLQSAPSPAHQARGVLHRPRGQVDTVLQAAQRLSTEPNIRPARLTGSGTTRAKTSLQTNKTLQLTKRKQLVVTYS